MRYRYLIVSLLGLLVGCQSLCPLRHLKPGATDINDPATQSQPVTDKMATPGPVPQDQPILVAPSSTIP
jgi:hypothetical protein